MEGYGSVQKQTDPTNPEHLFKRGSGGVTNQNGRVVVNHAEDDDE